MAYTVTEIERTVFGNLNVRALKITADAGTEAIATGFNRVAFVSAAPKSMASAPWSISINEGVAGTANAGYIGVTGVTSGDDFYVTVFGN